MDIKRSEEGRAWAQVVLPKEFQGYEKVAHGGIVASLLDEVMVHALWAKGIPNVTAELRIRFRAPVPVGEPLFVEGRVEGKKGRIFIAKAQLKNLKGEILAEGQSLLASVD
jgi:acyl-coenzyme A thioesterase PaaI-like protein